MMEMEPASRVLCRGFASLPLKTRCIYSGTAVRYCSGSVLFIALISPSHSVSGSFGNLGSGSPAGKGSLCWLGGRGDPGTAATAGRINSQ